MICEVLEKLDSCIAELEIIGEDMVAFDERVKDCRDRLSKILVKRESEKEDE